MASLLTFWALHRYGGNVVTSGSGELTTSGGAGSCVEEYSPAGAVGRTFAFDGTVIAVGSGTPGGMPPTNRVTFDVHERFRGPESASPVAVDMAKPARVPDADGVDSASYGIGTRLLVSGEPRWGGEPLDEAIAWGCGFTRYFSEPDAAAWRSAVQP